MRRGGLVVITCPLPGSVLRGDTWLEFEIRDVSSVPQFTSSGSTPGKIGEAGLEKEEWIRAGLSIDGCGLKSVARATLIPGGGGTFAGRFAVPPLGQACGEGRRRLVVTCLDEEGWQGSVEVSAGGIPKEYRINHPSEGDLVYLEAGDSGETLHIVVVWGKGGYPPSTSFALSLKQLSPPW